MASSSGSGDDGTAYIYQLRTQCAYAYRMSCQRGCARRLKLGWAYARAHALFVTIDIHLRLHCHVVISSTYYCTFFEFPPVAKLQS